VQIAGRIHEQGARERTSPVAEIKSCNIRGIAGRFSTTVAIRREAFRRTLLIMRYSMALDVRLQGSFDAFNG